MFMDVHRHPIKRLKMPLYPPADVLLCAFVRYNPQIAVGQRVGNVMGKQVNKLNARFVATVRTAGRHSDGAGERACGHGR